MDPISVIMGALAAGALAGAQGTATDAVKDAYATLKDIVHHRLAGRDAGKMALSQHEDRPDQWAPALQAELFEAGIQRDISVVQAAQQLLSLVDPVGGQSGKYSIRMDGAKGVQVGDKNTQHNTFGS